jgi:hypothetical protein
MKMGFLLALVGWAIGFAAPTFVQTFVQQTNTPDPQLRQRLIALFKNFDAAYNRNDATAVAANFTQDVILVTPCGPILGRQVPSSGMPTCSRGSI